MNFHFYVMVEVDESDTRHYTAYRNCDFDEDGIPNPLALTGHGESPTDAILDLCAEMGLVGLDWMGDDHD